MVAFSLGSLLDIKYTRRRVLVERGNAPKTGDSIRKIHMANPRIRLGTLSHCILLAAADYANPSVFYSVIYCSANKKLVDWSNNARRIEWPEIYSNLLWVNLTVTQNL